MTLHRWLIAGSVLELLVAVPTHVLVRRRPDCCAGLWTGAGICLGVAVMIVSFGHSVLLLYHRRRRQITPVRLSRGAGPGNHQDGEDQVLSIDVRPRRSAEEHRTLYLLWRRFWKWFA